jgi:hypothetical protein
MKTFINIIFCTIMLMAFSSCQKNVDTFIPDNFQIIVDTVWQNNIPSNASVFSLKSDLKAAKVSDSFSYSNTNVVFSSGAISLTIPTNSLVKNTMPLTTGIVQRETLLAIKKGDYIANDMPTTSNDRLLVSGGAVYLNLKNNGDNLFISQGKKITAKFNASTPFQYNRIFNASPDSSNGFNWIVNTDTAFNKSGVTATGYEIQTNNTQYVQTAHYMEVAGIAQTILTVKLPINYTNTNTVGYISFSDETSVAGLKPNVALHSFVSLLLPVNRPVTIVVISKQAGDYYLGTQQTTTTLNASNPSATIFVMPVKRSLEYIKAFLNTL